MGGTTGVLRRAVAAMAAAAVVVGGVGLALPGTARADSAPAPVTATDPVTVSADALPTVQINGVVWAQVVVGDTVYVAGKFTRARPAGAPAGDQRDGAQQPARLRHPHRAADHLLRAGPQRPGARRRRLPGRHPRSTSAATSPSPTGRPRNRVAAYDTRTGALVATFKPSVNGQVDRDRGDRQHGLPRRHPQRRRRGEPHPAGRSARVRRRPAALGARPRSRPDHRQPAAAVRRQRRRDPGQQRPGQRDDVRRRAGPRPHRRRHARWSPPGASTR